MDHLSVLLVEPEPEEMLFLHDVLREIEEGRWLPEWPRLELSSAATGEEMERMLAAPQGIPHVILLNPDLPGQQGAATFRLVQAAAPNIPVILAVNASDQALAVRLMREGAQDFLFKKSIDCAPLSHALRTAVLRHRVLAASRALVRMDWLTGLANRAGFLAAAERDRSLAERLNRSWLLLAAESRNSTSGAGPFSDQRRDIELVETADHLRAIATPADGLARIDERHFAMSVFVDSTETAEEALDRILAAAGQRGIEMGASIFDKRSPLSLDAMIGQALSALQRKPQASQETAGKKERSNFAGAA